MLAAAVIALVGWAAPGATLADPVVLTVTGNVAEPPVELTRADLEALTQHRLRTSTTVTDGAPRGF